VLVYQDIFAGLGHYIVEGDKSTYFPVDSGVSRDSVLGPSMFLCYINDTPTGVDSTIDCDIAEILLKVALNTIIPLHYKTFSSSIIVPTVLVYQDIFAGLGHYCFI
jgi:hypothetical protein